jgi:hypothetical protein
MTDNNLEDLANRYVEQRSVIFDEPVTIDHLSREELRSFFKKVSDIEFETIIRPNVRKSIMNSFPFSLLPKFT